MWQRFGHFLVKLIQLLQLCLGALEFVVFLWVFQLQTVFFQE